MLEIPSSDGTAPLDSGLRIAEMTERRLETRKTHWAVNNVAWHCRAARFSVRRRPAMDGIGKTIPIAIR